MKNKLLLALFLLSFVFVIPKLKSQNLPDKPNPPRLVNDFAGMLSSGEREALENKLVHFDDSTTNQIAIVTIDSLGAYDISDFATKLFQKWRIGEAKKNNGILILLSKSDHKVWIQVGYGLEAVVTDALAKRFTNLDMIPRFKAGQFYGGLDLATTHLMQLAKGEYHDVRPRPTNQPQGKNYFFLIILIIFLIILFSNGGGGSQQIGGRGLGFPFWFLLGALSGSDRGSSWGGSGGGGGGDSGGGGFGGFGGGDTGGGGAGGSW